MDCGDLISPENGEVLLLQESTLGATAIYSCDLGFLLVGTTLRQCEASGEWSPSEPICSRKSHLYYYYVDWPHYPNVFNLSTVAIF